MDPISYVPPDDKPWTDAEKATITDIEGLNGLVSEVIDVENGVIVRVADLLIGDLVAAKAANREDALLSANQALDQRREAQAREQPPDAVEP